MGKGQSKIEMLLELKNKIKTGLKQAKENLGKGVDTMKEKLGSLKAAHVEAFSAMRAEIPLFDKAMKMLGNPYVLAIAGTVALGALLGKATNKAAEFNHEFLNIKQLNLDKQQSDMDTYKGLIYDTAMATGLAATDTAKAFYDIQSGTGLFGKEVADITRQVGKFSIATGAELPDAVNQTIKAMKAFNLPASEVQSLLESNAKTVQVGITTFAELARVQTEYAGAAAGAGQNVDTANKVFAAFTSIAKDSNTAATMTKSAFEGLTQASTVKGLKSIGISLYDAQGNMRELGGVLKEVSGKFKQMSPKEIDGLINKIGGPEGLRNMFVKLKTGSEDFFATMEAYDSSKFNLDHALANAKGDFITLKKIVGNQFNTVMAKLGEKILPPVARFMEKVSNVLEYSYNHWEKIGSIISTVGSIVGTVLGVWKAWTAAQWLLNIAMTSNPIGIIVVAIMALIVGIVKLVKHTEGWAQSWQSIKTIMAASWEQVKTQFTLLKDTVVLDINIMLLKFKSFAQYVKALFQNIGKAISLAFKGDFSGAKEALQAKISTQASHEIETLKAAHEKQKLEAVKSMIENNRKIKEEWSGVGIHWKKKGTAEESESQSNPLMAGGGPLSGSSGEENSGNGGTESLGSGVNKIVGSAKQVKNITVNIDSFNKGGINTENTTLQNMDADQIEEWYTAMLMRMVRHFETAY